MAKYTHITSTKMMNLKSLDPYQASVSEKFAFNDHVKGTQRSLFTKLKFNSATNSGGQVTIYSKSTDSLIDKRMYIQMTVKVAENAADLTKFEAPRAFPVNSLIQNASVSINGANISTPSSDLIYGMQRCTAMPDDMRYYSTTPCQLDPVLDLTTVPRLKAYQIQDDADNAQARGGGNVADRYYAVENAQSPFLADTIATSNGLGCSGMDSIIPRGCFPGADGTGKTYVFTEPLFHSMLNDGDEVSAFCNVNRIDITLNFHTGDTAFKRIMSCAELPTQALTVEISNVHVLYREMSPTVPLPSVFRDNFPQYMVQKQAIGQAAATVTQFSFSFSNIVYNTHPSKLYIWCRPIDPAQHGLVTTTGTGFLIPKSISITAGTNSGLLSGLDTQGLYLLALDNGLKQLNYNQYANKLGGIIIIDCAKDLGLSPGRKEQLNINFTFSGTSIPLAAVADYECVCVSVLPSTLEISKDRCYVYEGFSMDDELEAERNDSAMEPVISVESKKVGAGFKGAGVDFAKFLNAGKSALKLAATAGKALQQSGALPPQAQAALGVLNSANSVINKGSGFHPRGLSGAGRLLQ